VQEIAAASAEQATGVEQANSALRDLDRVIQQNASSSEEMASTSEELSSQAQQLQSTVAFFMLEQHAALPPRPQEPLRRAALPAAKPKKQGVLQVQPVKPMAADNSNNKPLAGGVDLDMTLASTGTDDRDDMFEKY
jgi:methyl-accepting chemotaxis protein